MELSKLGLTVRLLAGGSSQRQVAGQVGLSKSAVQDVSGRLKRLGIDLKEASRMGPEGLHAKLFPPRTERLGYQSPDFVAVYDAHMRRGKSARDLKSLWEDYRASVAPGLKALGYKAFCQRFSRFRSRVPASCRDLELTREWKPGDTAMVDYAGDPIVMEDPKTGREIRIQLFVGVLPCSGYIFCCPTRGQTKDDWEDGLVRMLEFFGGAPANLYLDNSTSLVRKADRFDPKYTREFSMLCDHYGMVPCAARVSRPTDKAAVEVAVGLCSRFVSGPMRGTAYRGWEAVERTVAELRDGMNARPMTGIKSGSTRNGRFADEKPFLSPLPVLRLEPSTVVKVLKVQRNYLVRYKDRRFSVPCAEVGNKVRVVVRPRKGDLTVFSLRTGERIAHHFLTSPGGSTTVLPEHMPMSHRAATLTAEELAASAAEAGENAAALANAILAARPGEAGRKNLRGVCSLRNRVGDRLFEQCCGIVLSSRGPATYGELERVVRERTGLRPGRQVRIGRGKALMDVAAAAGGRGPSYYSSKAKGKREEEREKARTNQTGDGK